MKIERTDEEITKNRIEKAKFILSKNKAIAQYNIIKAISDIVSYSSKTNQDVTKILEKNTDSMFSVHHDNELKHITNKSKTIFIAQAWTNDEIINLLKQGINWFVVDNETDLNTLIKITDKNDFQKQYGKINLLLRLKLKENTIRTEKYFVFGMRSEIINKRLIELKNNNNINYLGIHFHRKTQNMAEWNLKYELENIIDSNNWKNIDIVNIGGGLPSIYANTNKDVIENILKKISEFKEWLNSINIKMIIEPGRFIAASCIELETTIISVDENNITVNASVYNTDMDAIIVPVKLLIKNEVDKKNGKPYIIKGMTPCSMDIFRYKAYLINPKAGDKLIFLNAGAYNFASDFCDLEKIKTEVIE
jgi:ornithine decarboxylase